jgi:uncharacterized protein (TIGR04255 family)
VEPAQPLEPLARPPIVEVVCGVRFAQLSDLDPLVLGAYWDQRKDTYPKHQLLPAITDQAFILQGAGLARVWFVSADEEFVSQFQQDRFYLNWRHRSGDYPRFSDHGANVGVLSRALDEFKQFSAFCQRTIGSRPSPESIELSKIDVFHKGDHWSDWDDLRLMLPVLEGFSGLVESDQAVLGINLSRTVEDSQVQVQLGAALQISAEGAAPRPVFKMETRASRSPGPTLRESFETANRALNQVFAIVVPEDERRRRFGAGK